ncbi:NAD(P)/FAD-dependent oxidoreductase [Neobacillus sp. 19]|uniref:NAD(P)/FAD-dependent oxidoreductase n=1 Tax=Neobacillus sp. 19 TaxID=3394458 RepID=UPI003BF6466C
MKDAIIIGAGIAGLSAAWRLREQNILVLESNDRVGGRIRSEKRGPYWLNWGGHVYAGPSSATGRLLKDVEVAAEPVPGTLTGLAMNGKLLLKGRVETYPFRVPMSWNSRFALMKAGIKVMSAVGKYGEMVTRKPNEDYWTLQQRVYDFMNDQSFTDFVGNLPDDADALFRPTVSRSAGDPEDVSAGAGVGYFNLVWSKGDSEGLSRNIIGGPSVLAEKITELLNGRVSLGTKVETVYHKKDSVVVIYSKDGKTFEEEARYVVITTPAPITKKIAVDIDDEMKEALGKIVYGPYVSAAFLTNETGKQVWDDAYAIATPKRSFNVAFNMSNIVRSKETQRKQGSSFMTFSPATLAKKLINKSEEEIKNIYLRDLDEIFPNFSKHVVEAHIQKWPLGLAYCFPGRGKVQQHLTRPSGRVYLAGDFLGTFYTDTAIETGEIAANRILKELGNHATENADNRRIV